MNENVVEFLDSNNVKVIHLQTDIEKHPGSIWSGELYDLRVAQVSPNKYNYVYGVVSVKKNDYVPFGRREGISLDQLKAYIALQGRRLNIKNYELY